MTKYEKVYRFQVIDELTKGTKVFLIDKSKAGSGNAIRNVSGMLAYEVLAAINSDNTDERFEFFKVVEI